MFLEGGDDEEVGKACGSEFLLSRTRSSIVKIALPESNLASSKCKVSRGGALVAETTASFLPFLLANNDSFCWSYKDILGR
jgi:hypothetical protein